MSVGRRTHEESRDDHNVVDTVCQTVEWVTTEE